jgi:hypothetical protein
MMDMPYCPRCGAEVFEDALYCSKCGHALKEKRGKLTVEELDIPFPKAENPELEISSGVAGYIIVEPGYEKFVQGTIEYDVPAWKPEITQTENIVSIKQQEKFTRNVWDAPKNDWKIKLGKKKPYQLRMKTGVSRGLWKLGSLPITSMNIETGVSQTKLEFDEPNMEVMELLRLQTGVGETSLTGLLNANFRQMRLDAGIGQVNLSYTGKGLERDANVRLEGGIGGLNIKIRKDLPAVFEVSGLSSVSHRGNIYRTSGGFGNAIYTTSTYDLGEKPVLSFKIGLGIGGISLTEV